MQGQNLECNMTYKINKNILLQAVVKAMFLLISTACFILSFFPHLLASRGKLVWVRGQRFKVVRDCLEVGDLSQQRNFLILKEKKNNFKVI